MQLDTNRTRRHLLIAAKILVVVLLAVSPRALLGPSSTFNRSQESKRPKTPKNIVRANSVQVSNLDRQGKEPRLPRTELCRLEERLASLRNVAGTGLPSEAFIQLTKPDYLQSSRTSLPQAQTSPPA